MANKNLTTNYLSRLSNANHDGVSQQICDRLRDFETENQMLIQAVNGVHQARQAEDTAFKRVSGKDFASDDLKREDALEDKYMSTALGILNGLLYLPETEPTLVPSREICGITVKGVKRVGTDVPALGLERIVLEEILAGEPLTLHNVWLRAEFRHGEGVVGLLDALEEEGLRFLVLRKLCRLVVFFYGFVKVILLQEAVCLVYHTFYTVRQLLSPQGVTHGNQKEQYGDQFSAHFVCIAYKFKK